MPALRGGLFHARREINVTRNPHRSFFWPNTGTRRHCRNSLFGYIQTDGGKITVYHFKNLRAGISMCTLLIA